MARSFDGSTDYFESASAPITSLPVTIAAWAKTNDLTTSQNIVAIGTFGSNARVAIGIAGASAGDPVQAQSITSANTVSTAISGSSGISAGQWFHAVGRFDSTTFRVAGVNGVYGATISTLNDPVASGWNRSQIGIRRAASGLAFGIDGSIAEVGIWNVGLATNEIEQLARGVCPLFVRPEALVAYVPMFGRGGASSDEQGWMGSGALYSQTGSPAVVDHPRIIYPRRRTHVYVPSAAPSYTHPTLSAATLVPAGGNTYQPRVSYSFP